MFVYPMSLGSIIRSIQEISITIAAGSTSNTATINAVTTANTVVPHNGQNSANAATTNPANAFGYFTKTNSTTITATRTDGTTDALIVYGVVIEFAADAVVSIQDATIVLASTVTTNTATITAVDTANAFPVYSGLINTTTGASTARAILSMIDLTNTTTATATRNLGTDSTTVALSIVELRPGIIKLVQPISVTTTSAATTQDTTITAVVMKNAMIFDNGIITGSANFANTNMYRQYLTTTTNHRYERVGTATTSRTMKSTVVELHEGYIRAKTTGQTTLTTADTQIDTGVTMTDRNKVFVNYNGRTNSTTTSTWASIHLGVLSTSTTNVRSIRNAVGTIEVTGAFEMTEFI